MDPVIVVSEAQLKTLNKGKLWTHDRRRDKSKTFFVLRSRIFVKLARSAEYGIVKAKTRRKSEKTDVGFWKEIENKLKIEFRNRRCGVDWVLNARYSDPVAVSNDRIIENPWNPTKIKKRKNTFSRRKKISNIPFRATASRNACQLHWLIIVQILRKTTKSTVSCPI